MSQIKISDSVIHNSVSLYIHLHTCHNRIIIIFEYKRICFKVIISVFFMLLGRELVQETLMM